MGRSRRVLSSLPLGLALAPGDAEHPQRRHPVIVLLHGGSGDQSDWFDPRKGDALATLQRLYQEGGCRRASWWRPMATTGGAAAGAGG